MHQGFLQDIVIIFALAVVVLYIFNVWASRPL
jgi:hypothetical protein